MAPLICEATNVFTYDNPENTVNNTESGEGSNEVAKGFYKLKEDAEAALYPFCKTFTRLEFLITLLHIKVSCKWSDKSFSTLLKALHRALNYDENFPENSYEAKKYTRALGLDYVKIDACINHCILYWKENKGLDKCPKCDASRWKEKVSVQGDNHIDTDDDDTSKVGRVLQLVLRHFPLIARLQRMFMSLKLAEHMRWYKEGRSDDGKMRHLADSKAWKHLDELYANFVSNPRNVRLALFTDGFNPGAQISSQNSIWLVMLVPYNLPPWMCMDTTNVMLSLLIPGPKA